MRSFGMDSFRQGFKLGLSAASLSGEALTKLIDSLGLKDETSDAQAEQLLAQVMREVEAVADAGQETAEELLSRAGLATLADLDRLEARVAALERAAAGQKAAPKKAAPKKTAPKGAP